MKYRWNNTYTTVPKETGPILVCWNSETNYAIGQYKDERYKAWLEDYEFGVQPSHWAKLPECPTYSWDKLNIDQ
jgi:hypothetical protein